MIETAEYNLIVDVDETQRARPVDSMLGYQRGYSQGLFKAVKKLSMMVDTPFDPDETAPSRDYITNQNGHVK